MDRLRELLGPPIDDADEEFFLVFSQSIPSNSLGFVDAKAVDMQLTVDGKDYSIAQSPGLLHSNRSEGTTGAVLWQVSPRLAAWIADETNVLWSTGRLHAQALVVELGCGVSGIVSLALGPKIGRYVATDQNYVLKMLKQNLHNNTASTSSKHKAKGPKQPHGEQCDDLVGNVLVRSLDWESDSAESLLRGIDSHHGADLVVACDCIYNEALVMPFVHTCRDICRLSPTPCATLVVVAQQIRSPQVFEEWIIQFHALFDVWRLTEDAIAPSLGEDSGFVVHVGVLRQ